MHLPFLVSPKDSKEMNQDQMKTEMLGEAAHNQLQTQRG